MLFGSSGSPVIFKECGICCSSNAHGYGEGNKYMFEYLKIYKLKKDGFSQRYLNGLEETI
jgi:hypothetical protein